MKLQMQMLLWRLRKKQAFQSPQKICNRQQRNCQTRSWKKQLAELALSGSELADGIGGHVSDTLEVVTGVEKAFMDPTPSKPLH